MLNRNYIYNLYPWLLDNSPKYVIMGDDLDAGLSTLIYLLKNPNSQLIGIYTGYKKIFFNSNFSKNDLKNCIYIDLDIYFPSCYSLGHHIVRIDKSNQLLGFANSCNINELENRSITNLYSKKYPLGTIHFLLWLYKEYIPKTEFAEQLIWLADSSFINGQSHRFRKNVYDWTHNLMNSSDMRNSYENIETLYFENKTEGLQKIMQNAGLNKGSGQVKSLHKKLTGFQCQPTENENVSEIKDYINNLFQFISEITGWKIPKEQVQLNELSVIQGDRKSGDISKIVNGNSLDSFLENNKVFSYVFPFKDSINLTTNIL